MVHALYQSAASGKAEPVNTRDPFRVPVLSTEPALVEH
jgi:hypothetical protein